MALRLFAPAPLRMSPSILPFAFALPISITIPPLLADLWESVLRAVPKKKTSHMKKRHRQMAGKALKDVQSLNKCPGCGQVKRAHLLCPHCVRDIRDSWKTAQTA
ncbi:54S ribosomal protein L32 [Penicillium cosmopolitanum]|uniref:Large ribosomal subunit protein bL32m n=1 Tax=Penicillium cosmopolitanum TaxID=1131564 RepID=A0A9W9S219_9EURO|nr:54S ribosomal protein L32 [Penicillium cosmopolitanum]KAJ5369599.1 54S ribosomal protein L32 [Penicillium cosmopolitanum]